MQPDFELLLYRSIQELLNDYEILLKQEEIPYLKMKQELRTLLRTILDAYELTDGDEHDFDGYYLRRGGSVSNTLYYQVVVDLEDRIRDSKKALLGEQKADSTDTDLERFMRKCKELKLPKKKTIPRETLFEMMSDLKLCKGQLDDFIPGSKACLKAREYASRAGYSRKGSAIHEK